MIPEISGCRLPGLLRRALRSVKFVPDFLFVVVGFDAHRAGPPGNLELPNEAYGELTADLCEYAGRACGGRLVSVLGGGYNPETSGSLVARHVEVLSLGGDSLPAMSATNTPLASS